MADTKVQYQIEVIGNALEQLKRLTGEASNLSKKAKESQKSVWEIGKTFIGLNQAFEVFSKFSGQLKEFAEANRAQVEAEAKLAQVMRNTMGASAAEVQSIKDLAAAQQQLGVIGDEVQIAGAQELGTYLAKADSLKKLLPVMNDMLAQQYGLNASQEQAVQIASMMGKVMEGQVGALFSKLGQFGIGFMGIVGTIKTITGVIGSAVGRLKKYADASRAQQEAEAKLAQVMRNTMGASAAEVQSIKDLAAAQQQLGVIGDEVQIAGAQELGTYLAKADSLKKLLPVMNDMLAQQYGLNASQEQAVQIASMMGKVMEGQVGALSRYGYKFDEAQEKILKYGTEEQKAATLAEVIEQSVGGMNAALAATPEGRLKQASNRLGDLKEQLGNIAQQAASAFLPLIDPLIRLSERAMPKIAAALQPAIDFMRQLAARAAQFIPLVEQAFLPLQDLFASLSSHSSTSMGYMERYAAVIRQHVLPAVQNIMGVVSRIVGSLIDFFANSALLQDFFSLLWTLSGKVWDTLSWIFSQVEKFFNKVVMPIVHAIEKIYRWVAGKKDEDAPAKATPSRLGIAEVRLPGDGRATSSLGTGPDSKAGKAAEAAVTGGTRNTQITINLGKMVENIVFNGTLEDNLSAMQQQVEEALLRTLYAAQSAAV